MHSLTVVRMSVHRTIIALLLLSLPLLVPVVLPLHQVQSQQTPGKSQHKSRQYCVTRIPELQNTTIFISNLF